MRPIYHKRWKDPEANRAELRRLIDDALGELVAREERLRTGREAVERSTASDRAVVIGDEKAGRLWLRYFTESDAVYFRATKELRRSLAEEWEEEGVADGSDAGGGDVAGTTGGPPGGPGVPPVVPAAAASPNGPNGPVEATSPNGPNGPVEAATSPNGPNGPGEPLLSGGVIAGSGVGGEAVLGSIAGPDDPFASPRVGEGQGGGLEVLASTSAGSKSGSPLPPPPSPAARGEGGILIPWPGVWRPRPRPSSPPPRTDRMAPPRPVPRTDQTTPCDRT